MSKKKVQIKIKENGEIIAWTEGVKGEECTKFIGILEDILHAKVIDSSFTEAYHQTEILSRAEINQLHKEE